MFKVTPKGVLFLLSYFPGYRIHLYIPATHFFYGVYQQLQNVPKSGERANAGTRRKNEAGSIFGKNGKGKMEGTHEREPI